MTEDEREVEEWCAALERIIAEWLEHGVTYVRLGGVAQLMPLFPLEHAEWARVRCALVPWGIAESLDNMRYIAKRAGAELLDLRQPETQARVAKFFLDLWVQEAREQGRVALAAAGSRR